ncbi:MAG: DNA polymerase III subunit delta' [Acidobacteriaceae bacterium]
MSFDQFLGNSTTVTRLRETIAAGRLPAAMILSGPAGAGKYTLATMLAQTANCLLEPASNGLPDFCGACANCTRIGAALPLRDRFAEAVAAREELRDVDKKDTRILIQTHPDLLVIPPDPPQLLIKLGQVRAVISRIYRRPAEARRAFYIFTSSAFMKEAANSLLKMLEEPPDHASLILLTANPSELLPTIRSRAPVFHLGAVPTQEIDRLLAERRPELKPQQRVLVGHLAEGAIGRALGFDLDAYLAHRTDGLILLRHALGDPDHSALFRMTEAYRAGAEGQEKTAGLLHALSLLLEDLLLLHSGAPSLIRNTDMAPELTRIAQSVTPAWIESASRGLDAVESGMRRNLLRSLSLDAFASGLISR